MPDNMDITSAVSIDFTVANQNGNDGCLINNLSLIAGAPTYTITVAANQTCGTYKLAQGAENFTGSVTIRDNAITYGSLAVNGNNFLYNDTIYSLAQINGNLTLTIKEYI